MQEKILFVDDEPPVLTGYQRLFRNDFKIDIAVGGKGGLIALKSTGPYAVVVSDMRMPGMNGVEFLREVKNQSPDAIRIMLTGQADLDAAIASVNEGNIYRFLTKPCDKETLGKTLTAALVQYRLVIAERELLEETLKGSIQVLSEVLSLVNPAAFSRAMRLKRYISHVVAKLRLSKPWRYEVAAMMSQLGCVALAPETIDAVFAGQQLSAEEQARYDSHPAVAKALLENIPRMEPIAWMIAHQNTPITVDTDIANREMADMRQGAELLQLMIAFDELLRKGRSRTEAAHTLAKQYRYVDKDILYALVELDPEKQDALTQTCQVGELTPGAVLDQDVYSSSGSLIVTRGQEVTSALIIKLKNFEARGAISGTVTVLVPRGRGNHKVAGASE